jgi:hypothetical protein
MFDLFWEVYGKKVGKKAAATQWGRHISDEATAMAAIEGAQRQAEHTEKKYRKDPERWIRDHRWADDELIDPSGSAGTIARLQARVHREGL